ncbi:conserved hypothetical protein [Pantoea brenneri]|jgi:hypothetical protein|uniref:Transposase n=1 Tax=Pantoea brenneri TaxID=472694 RepID=A0AAX3J8B5_9GAMM|nr:conserved hypothetical protein [Pantoea brenneri]
MDLCVRQAGNNQTQIAFGHHAFRAQVTFTLSRFFGQNMTQVCVFTLEAARSGLLEALSRATYSFNLWHFKKYPLRIVDNMTQTGEQLTAQRERCAANVT